MLPVNLQNILNKYDKFINDSLSDFDDELINLEKELYNSIVSDYLSKFHYDKNGELIEDYYNYSLLTKLNSFMDEFYDTFEVYPLKNIAKRFLQTVTYSSEYYRTMGVSREALERIKNKLNYLSARIGIDKDGNLIKGGFLYNIGQVPQLRQMMTDLVIENISKQSNSTEFLRAMKKLIRGSKDVNGGLTRYLRQYIHDTMWQISRAVDKNYAEELNLNYAYYVGTAIDKTRDFCLARIGKLFTREEIKSWENETWAGKIEGGDIFIDLGGYNCRHRLGWVTDEKAARDLEKNEE